MSNQQHNQNQFNRLGLRGKLISIFVLIKMVPLTPLTIFLWSQWSAIRSE